MTAVFARAAYGEGRSAAPPEQKQAAKRTLLTVSQAIEKVADYEGRTVVVVGMFMGFEGKCAKPSPGPGDWMLQDESGKCIWARGYLPENFSAGKKQGVGARLAGEGLLRNSSGKPLFISLMPKEVEEKLRKKRDERLKQKLMKDEL
ncbi:MAG TPA: hypothetical protein PLQ76_08985, partial [bacterium]|nr:hypothetical protein [bacterium]